MAVASDPTLVGTFVSRHDADTARERLRLHGIEPATVKDDLEGVWTVHVPGDRREKALEQMQMLEQRRGGTGL